MYCLEGHYHLCLEHHDNYHVHHQIDRDHICYEGSGGQCKPLFPSPPFPPGNGKDITDSLSGAPGLNWQPQSHNSFWYHHPLGEHVSIVSFWRKLIGEPHQNLREALLLCGNLISNHTSWWCKSSGGSIRGRWSNHWRHLNILNITFTSWFTYDNLKGAMWFITFMVFFLTLHFSPMDKCTLGCDSKFCMWDALPLENKYSISILTTTILTRHMR